MDSKKVTDEGTSRATRWCELITSKEEAFKRAYLILTYSYVFF